MYINFDKTSEFSKIKYKGRFYVKKAGDYKFFVSNPYENFDFKIKGKTLSWNSYLDLLADDTVFSE